MEWNAHDPSGSQGVVGAWNSHIRVGSAEGTNLGSAQCAKSGSTSGNKCYGAFMSLHITAGASAYIEVSSDVYSSDWLMISLVSQGMWVWVGDHDLDGSHTQVNVYAGRGILSESQGPVWLVGTAGKYLSVFVYDFVFTLAQLNITPSTTTVLSALRKMGSFIFKTTTLIYFQ